MELIIHIGSPVVIGLIYKTKQSSNHLLVNVLSTLRSIHTSILALFSTQWINPFFQISECAFFILETRHILIPNKHHFYKHQNSISKFLKCLEPTTELLITYSIIKSLKYKKVRDLTPPRISTNSFVSLNGALSNRIPLPGAFDSKNPKSICTICPYLSISKLALCRSLIYRM